MRLLLDTHALLWWALDDSALSERARDAIADAEATVYVSAASAWELATKVRLGKLPGAERLAAELGAYVTRQDFTPLPITLEHGQRAGSLPGPHRDPFDRMLVAQAQLEGLMIVTHDPDIERYAVPPLAA